MTTTQSAPQELADMLRRASRGEQKKILLNLASTPINHSHNETIAVIRSADADNNDDEYFRLADEAVAWVERERERCNT